MSCASSSIGRIGSGPPTTPCTRSPFTGPSKGSGGTASRKKTFLPCHGPLRRVRMVVSGFGTRIRRTIHGRVNRIRHRDRRIRQRGVAWTPGRRRRRLRLPEGAAARAARASSEASAGAAESVIKGLRGHRHRRRGKGHRESIRGCRRSSGPGAVNRNDSQGLFARPRLPRCWLARHGRCRVQCKVKK